MPSPVKKKRPRKTVVEKPAPIVQVMPKGRARIDPSVVPQLSCFLLCMRRRYEKQAEMTCSGFAQAERDRRKAQADYAKRMVAAYSEVVRGLLDTVDLHDFDRITAEWQAGIDQATGSESPCHSQNG